MADAEGGDEGFGDCGIFNLFGPISLLATVQSSGILAPMIPAIAFNWHAT